MNARIRTIALAALAVGITAAATAAHAAESACTGLARGTYVVKTHGTFFIAALETYTTKVTYDPDADQLTVYTNWGPDHQYTLDGKAHTLSKIDSMGFPPKSYSFIQGDPRLENNSYQWELANQGSELYQLQTHEIGKKTSPAAAQALACAIERLANERKWAVDAKNDYDAHARKTYADVDATVKQVSQGSGDTNTTNANGNSSTGGQKTAQ